MALATSEISRIKAELGYNLLSSTALPYVDVAAIFETAIQNNVQAGASTTSSTTVAAASGPTPVTLSIASATGFAAHERVVVDVDSRQESATVQALSGTDITLLLEKAHTGTYRVEVEGGETIVRETLAKLASVKEELGENYGAGALKAVDEIQFYQAKDGETYFGILGRNLAFWRGELASQIGIPDLWSRKRSAGSEVTVY